MGQRAAFYKFLRLGDYLDGVQETPGMTAKGVEMAGSPWSNDATPVPQGPGTHASVDLKVAFFKDDDTPETVLARVLDFLNGFRKAAGTSQVDAFSLHGPLVLVDDDEDDIAGLSSQAAGGEAVSLNLDAAMTVAIGEYVLLTDEASLWELRQVVDVVSSTEIKVNLTNTFPAAAKVAKAHFYLEQAYVTSAVQVPGGGDAGYRLRNAVSLQFQSVEDFTHVLVGGSFLLKEDGAYLLQEDGELIATE